MGGARLRSCCSSIVIFVGQLLVCCKRFLVRIHAMTKYRAPARDIPPLQMANSVIVGLMLFDILVAAISICIRISAGLQAVAKGALHVCQHRRSTSEAR